MSSSEFNAVIVVHVASALMLVGFTFFAFAADPAKRKLTLAWGGVASLLVLLTGIRMWQEFDFGWWKVVKVVCWIVISALTGIGFRRRAEAGAWMVLTLVAAALAVAMAYLKPF